MSKDKLRGDFDIEIDGLVIDNLHEFKRGKGE